MVRDSAELWRAQLHVAEVARLQMEIDDRYANRLSSGEPSYT